MGRKAYKDPDGSNRQIDQLKLRLYEGQRIRLLEDPVDYGANPLENAKSQFVSRWYTITQFFTNHILLTSESGCYKRCVTYYDFLLWGATK